MILGVDPGGTVGVSLYDHNADVAVVGLELPALAFGAFARELLGDVEPPWVVACERFVIGQQTHKKTRQHDAIEVIGVLRNLCAWHYLEFDLQMAGAAKRLVKNDLLRAVGVYAPTAGGHANDASRHVWLYVARRMQRRFFDAKSGGYRVDARIDEDGSKMMEYVGGLRRD